MDAKLIESMRFMNQVSAWETYGKDAVAVVSQGTPGEYADNPTVKDFEAKGYKLVDANMFGQGNESGEILVFARQ